MQAKESIMKSGFSVFYSKEELSIGNLCNTKNEYTPKS